MARWLWNSWGIVLCMTMAQAIGGDAPVALTARQASPGMVAQLTLDGPIGPAAAEYLDEASKRAIADGATAIVLRLDTPGGLLDSMRQIIARMLACKIAVLVYVAPSGARAASAGTYILYAGQIAAMAPATHVGALSLVVPDVLTPQDLGSILDTSFEIAVRPGLHCAPYLHRRLGTFPDGTLRLSPGPFTTDDQITTFLDALTEITAGVL